MKRDGIIHHCPLCRTILPTPATAYGEAHCPRCDGRLWHMAFQSGTAFFVRRPTETIYDVMAALADPSARFTLEFLQTALEDADRLDVVEVLAHLEGSLRP